VARALSVIPPQFSKRGPFLGYPKMEGKEKMRKGLSAWLERAGSKTGAFLSHFPSVLITLLVYLSLSVVTWGALCWKFYPDWKKSLVIAYTIATAGDPLPFRSDFRSSLLLFSWLLFFRIIAWLLVPVLVATAIDASYRSWETRRREAEARILRHLRKYAKEELRLTGSELDQFIKDAFIDFSDPEAQAVEPPNKGAISE